MKKPDGVCDQCFGFRQKTRTEGRITLHSVYCRHTRIGAQRGEFAGGLKSEWQPLAAPTEAIFDRAIDAVLRYGAGKIGIVRFQFELMKIVSGKA
ncbi:MAG TPA: hypothetical protein VGA88_02040 [Burkholderiales bacterium]